MEIFLAVLLFAVGLVLIIKGGDFFVDAASFIAEVSGIPKFIIGATIVSIATTLPEMIVSMIAAADASVDMSIGNAVGSVTANVGLIMAISLLFMPSVIKRSDYILKSALMIGAGALLIVFGLDGGISVVEGIVFLIIFAVSMGESVIRGRRASIDLPKESRRKVKSRREAVIYILKFIFGAAGIVIGAQLLVTYGGDLAGLLGVPERVISVTLVAIGTSLPELVTTLTAISKKESSLSVGNIIGANILDLTLIMPLCAVVSGGTLPMPQKSLMIDIPACVIVGLIALVPALISGKFRRWQGFALLAVYASYVTYTVAF